MIDVGDADAATVGRELVFGCYDFHSQISLEQPSTVIGFFFPVTTLYHLLNRNTPPPRCLLAGSADLCQRSPSTQGPFEMALVM